MLLRNPTEEVVLRHGGMPYFGLDMEACGKKISQLIDDSGLSDKEIGNWMGLSVQAINKWRHGRNLPDIENLFVLSSILGKKVDDFLVPLEGKTSYRVVEFEHEKSASRLPRLRAYLMQLWHLQDGCFLL